MFFCKVCSECFMGLKFILISSHTKEVVYRNINLKTVRISVNGLSLLPISNYTILHLISKEIFGVEIFTIET